MVKSYIDKISSKTLLMIGIVSLVLIAGLASYFVWMVISAPKEEQNNNLSTKTTNWITYVDKYVPLKFDHPKEWKIESAHYSISQALMYAFTNHDQANEKLMLKVSYHRDVPKSNAEKRKAESWVEGVAAKPKCPLDVEEKATDPGCELVSNSVTSGYMYELTKGEDKHRIFKWHGRTNDERIEVQSEVATIDRDLFRRIVASLKYHPSRTDNNKLIPFAELQDQEKEQSKRNYDILNTAAKELSIDKCSQIEGVLYQMDFDDSSKVRVFDQWQTFTLCRGKVQAVIKAYNEELLNGDNCAELEIYSHLHRVIGNAEIVQIGYGKPFLVQTVNGEREIRFQANTWQGPHPDHVDSDCKSLSTHHFKVGDIVNVYTLRSNTDPQAYANDMRLIQKINSTMPGPRLPFDPVVNKPMG